jgi:gamma-glutamyltranspeptidase/glutathione hydrolase
MQNAFASGWSVTKPAVAGRTGIVSAQNRKAAEVGAEVLRAGGNAIDAAVATSMALGAVEPWMSGIGGGGCMLVWPADAGPRAVDFGMIAPRRLDPGDYPLTGATAGDLFSWPAVVEDRNIHGALSVALPTQVAGLALAHERWGTMPWAELLQPAARLAREGLELDWFVTLVVANAARDLARYPTSKEIWLPHGVPPVEAYPGDGPPLPLGRLADTITTIATEGPKAVYRGAVGEAIVGDLAGMGGTLGMEDFGAYGARVLEPLEIAHRGARFFAMPGLFAGPTFARCLELVGERAGGAEAGAELYIAVADALRQAYAERLERMGDESPLPSSTSAFSVVDRHGMLVSVTQTLLSVFGSRVVSPSTGLLLNNGVMWFDPRPGRPNSLGAGKRPLSNMCPVLGELPALVEGRRVALGASGGRRILPAILQLSLFMAELGLGLEAAFHMPRIDVSGGEVVSGHPELPAPVRAALAERLSFRTVRPAVYPTVYACPSGVMRHVRSGLNEGAAEPVHPWAGPVAEPRADA